MRSTNGRVGPDYLIVTGGSAITRRPPWTKSLEEGRCAAPFDVLGVHSRRASRQKGSRVRAFIPWAAGIAVVRDGEETPMRRVGQAGGFEAVFRDAEGPFPYRLAVEDRQGNRWTVEDPYRFGPALDLTRARDFLDGAERRVHEVLGARTLSHEGVDGVLFSVWAPNAAAVSVTGDLNGWDGRCHPMRRLDGVGMWELFVPGVELGSRYKYQVVTASGGRLEKADPCGRAAELRPAAASEVWDPRGYVWSDDAWVKNRAAAQADDGAMSVYEVHLGSWRRTADAEPGWRTYRELAEELLPYVLEMGFTHVEVLPVLEHPLDQSWGYQPLGFFAPTSRFGTPDDFRFFVDRAHQLGLGVLLDWVPGHFPEDEHGLARFDGTELYELPDPVQARHPDWGTLVFDYGNPAVRSFLISSAIHWLEDYHLDGLRVDAVASMLYLDYSRGEGEWTPNEHGGNENLHAVDFLKSLNDAVHEECPGAVTIAEESTAWPGVSHGTDHGGLGFDQKWNMGWMNDTLQVMQQDTEGRRDQYDRLTFSIVYAHSERFCLPLSHDEVVHGKRSLLSKMPGSNPEKFSSLRTLLAYQWAHPGRKLLFMGSEFGQWTEWNSDGALDWALLGVPEHAGIRHLVGDLNQLYTSRDALHQQDYKGEGFEWLDCEDAERCTLSFVRWSGGHRESVLVAVNLTPTTIAGFRLPTPHSGRYRLLLNTDAPEYGGGGVLVPAEVATIPGGTPHRDQHLLVPLPGLSVLYFERVGD